MEAPDDFIRRSRSASHHPFEQKDQEMLQKAITLIGRLVYRYETGSVDLWPCYLLNFNLLAVEADHRNEDVSELQWFYMECCFLSMCCVETAMHVAGEHLGITFIFWNISAFHVHGWSSERCVLTLASLERGAATDA